MTTRPSHQAWAGQLASYQERVQAWLDACFGREIASDKTERNHRFLEEALETVQAGGCTASEAHQIVDYVYGRPVGELHQEVGGVMNTLAALCLAHGLDMHECGEVELARVWTKVEKIRAKQAAKPKHSPLPEAPLDAPPCNSTDVEDREGANLRDNGWCPTHRHVKRGSYYQLVAYANLQTSRPLEDMADLVIYRDRNEFWVRPYEEFEDGRFVRIDDAPPHVAPETLVERDGGAS